MRVLLAVAVLVSSSALAQTSGLTLSLTSSQTTFGHDNCRDRISVSWTATPPTTNCTVNDLQIYVTTASSCTSTGPAAGDYSQTITSSNWQANRQGTVTIPVSALPVLTTGTDGGAIDCASSSVQATMTVCGHYSYITSSLGTCSSTATDVTVAASPQIIFDTQNPNAPTITAVHSLDSALGVDVTAASGATTNDTAGGIDVYYRVSGTNQVWTLGGQGTPDSTITVSGLTNNVSYDVAARAIDEANNYSDYSASMTGVPLPTRGFWENYKNDGGAERGGCSVAGGLGLGLVPLLLGAWALRRSRR